MSNNSWKQYGGTLMTDTVNKFRAGVIVADELLLRQKYSGEFEVLADINVGGDIIGSGNLLIKNPVPDNSPRFEVSTSVMSVHMDAFLRNQLYLGTNGTDYLSGGTNGIGLNTTTPDGTFEIVGRTGIPYNFIVSSSDTQAKTVIARNVNDRGIVATTTDTNSSIEFFNGAQTVEGGAASLAAILYDSTTGRMSFQAPLIGFSDSAHSPFYPQAYDLSGVTGTTLSMTSGYVGDACANTFITATTQTGVGAGFGGGMFPSDDACAFGILSSRTANGTTRPSYVFVNNAEDICYNYVRSGIHTYNPDPSYSITLNGKTRVGHSEHILSSSLDAIAGRIISDFDPAITDPNLSKVKYFAGGPTFKNTQGDSVFGIYENTNYGIGPWMFHQLDALGQSTSFMSVSSPLHVKKRIDITTTVDHILKIAAYEDNKFFYYNSKNGSWRNGSPYQMTILDLSAGADYKYVENANFGGHLFMLLQETANTGNKIRGLDFNTPTGEVSNTTGTPPSIFYATSLSYDIGRPIINHIYTQTQLSNITIHNSFTVGEKMYLMCDNGVHILGYDDTQGSTSTARLTYTNLRSGTAYYGIYKGDANYFIMAGDNVITYTLDAGVTWHDITVSDIPSMLGTAPVLRGVEITSSSGSLLDEIVIVGEDIMLTHYAGKTKLETLSYWTREDPNEFNGNGSTDAIIGPNSKPIDIHKTGGGLYSVIADTTPSTYTAGDVQTGCTNVYTLYAPTLSDGDGVVLDVMGDIKQSGAMYQF